MCSCGRPGSRKLLWTRHYVSSQAHFPPARHTACWHRPSEATEVDRPFPPSDWEDNSTYAQLFMVARLGLATEFTSEVAKCMHCHSQRQIFLMSLCAKCLDILVKRHAGSRPHLVVSKQHEIGLLIPHKVLNMDDAFKGWLHSQMSGSHKCITAFYNEAFRLFSSFFRVR